MGKTKKKCIELGITPQAISAPGVHEKVVEFLKNKKGGKLLDAPAGEGALSLSLKKMGFEIWAADLNTERFKPTNIECKAVNLNDAIPYSDLFFDYIICVEGIEHLENPHHLIREFNRVLKTGGELIVTTPNIQNLRSRIKFFLFGSYCYFGSKIDIGDKFLREHINPLSFSEIEMVFYRNGFSLVQIETNRYIKISPKILRSIWEVVNRKFNRAYNERLQIKELLFGDILILVARKIT